MVPNRNPGPAHPEGWTAAQTLMSHSRALAAQGKHRVAPALDPASSEAQQLLKAVSFPGMCHSPTWEQKWHHCPLSQLKHILVNPAQCPESW